MRAKATIQLAAASSAVLLAAACGGAGSGSSGDAPKASGNDAYSGAVSGNLQTLGFSLPDEIATVRVDTFKTANTGVTVKVNEGGFDEQQFLSAVAGGTPPEIVYISRETIGTYAQRGAILPLTDCIEQRDIDMEQFRPAALDQLKYKDVYYGIPEFYNTPLIIMNNDVLKAAGVSPDDIDLSNQQKTLEAARKMTVRKGNKLSRLGIDIRLPDLTPLYGIVDGNPFITDANTIKLNDPKTIATYERLKQIEDVQGGFTNVKEFKDTWDFFGEKNEFVRNQVGAMVIEQWYLNVLADTAPNANITAKAITDVNGKPITWASGNAWAIPKGSKNPKAACEFAKTMTLPSTWEAAAQERVNKRKAENKVNTGTFTANIKADDIIFGKLFQPQGGKFKPFEDGVKTTLTVQEGAWTVPATAVGAEFKTAWQGATTRVLLGQQPAAAALAQAQKEVDAALAKIPKS